MKFFNKTELILFLLFGGLFCLYLFLIPFSPYWLDSPEFVASAFSFSLSHPPGHPFYLMIGKFFSMIPLGNIAFRLNLMSAVCALVALIFGILCGFEIMSKNSNIGKRISILIPLLCIIPIALSPGWIHQATHAEVYSFETMLLSMSLWFFIKFLIVDYQKDKNVPFQTQYGDSNFKFLLLGLVTFSLSLAVHPFISLTLLPAIVAAIATHAVLWRWQYPVRKLLVISASLSIGTLVYLFIAVRGNVSPTMIMGKVETLWDFLWTVSAKVYQKSASVRGIYAVKQRESGTLFLLLKEIGFILPLLSSAGVYFLLRKVNLLPAGILYLLGIFLTLLSRVLLPFDTANPDVIGYMMIIEILISGATCAFFFAIWQIKWGRVLGIILLFTMVVHSIFEAKKNITFALKMRDCPRLVLFLLDSEKEGNTLPFAKDFSTLFSTSFLQYYDEKVKLSRPDEMHISVPFLGYRGVAEDVAKTSSEMRKVALGYIATGEIRASDLAELALYNPVYYEPYPDISEEFIPYLIPQGIKTAFYSQPVSKEDFASATRTGNENIRHIINRAGICLQEPQTERYLLWLIYNRALLAGRRGAIKEAIESANLGLKINPDIPELKNLIQFLQKTGKPIKDISPFLPPKID